MRAFHSNAKRYIQDPAPRELTDVIRVDISDVQRKPADVSTKLTAAVPNSSSLMSPPPNSIFRVARVAAYNIFCRTCETTMQQDHVTSVSHINVPY